MNIQNYIAQANKLKNEKLSKTLKTGDVLKVKSEFFPLIFHYVIVQKNDDDFVIIHNDPHKINFLGGNIVREDFYSWIIGKEIVEVIPTTITDEIINKMVNEIKTSKFNVLHNNCEHFVSKLNFQKPTSPQIITWSIVILTIITTFIIVKKK